MPYLKEKTFRGLDYPNLDVTAGKAITVMVVITNTDECGVVVEPVPGFVTAGDTAATYMITEA